jgi:hypothetical protein
VKTEELKDYALKRSVETVVSSEARIAELEAALRDVRQYLDDISDHPEPRDTIEMIDKVLG